MTRRPAAYRDARSEFLIKFLAAVAFVVVERARPLAMRADVAAALDFAATRRD